MTTAPAPPAVLRFIAALHRRAVVLRVAERTGLGMLGGAALAILLTLLLWRQNQASVGVALAAIAVGGVLGFAWGIARRPSRLDAAVQADAQLNLDDLLGTAVALSSNPRTAAEPWAMTVLAVAESTCRTRSPSAVVLHRLGARVWGGIGLASALALTLAILVSAPTGSVASVAPSSSTSADGSAVRPLSRPLIAIAPDSALRARAPGDPEDPAGPAGQSNPDRAAAAQPQANGPPPQPGADPSAGGATAGDPAGSGSGFSKSTPPPTTPPPREARPGEPVVPAPAPPPAAGTPQPAGGGTASDPTATPAATVPPGVTGRSAAGTSGDPGTAPPWHAGSWSNDVQAARKQLDAGRIPPAYRDLVRQYFEPSPRR